MVPLAGNHLNGAFLGGSFAQGLASAQAAASVGSCTQRQRSRNTLDNVIVKVLACLVDHHPGRSGPGFAAIWQCMTMTFELRTPSIGRPATGIRQDA